MFAVRRFLANISRENPLMTLGRASILKNAPTSSEAIRLLFQECKKGHRKFTLSYLRSHLGLKSNGFLSDVMKGRRRLHPRLGAKLSAALSLTDRESEVLQLLLERDFQKSALTKRQFARKVATSKKLISLPAKPLASRGRDIKLIYFKVFSALGICNGSATVAALVNIFPKESTESIRDALDFLIAQNWIEKDAAGYRTKESVVVFDDGEDGVSHLDFLRATMNEARDRVAEWYNERKSALFQASFLSVKKDDYETAIARLRSHLLETQANLETEEGEILINFNVQIYPESLKTQCN